MKKLTYLGLPTSAVRYAGDSILASAQQKYTISEVEPGQEGAQPITLLWDSARNTIVAAQVYTVLDVKPSSENTR